MHEFTDSDKSDNMNTDEFIESDKSDNMNADKFIDSEKQAFLDFNQSTNS